MITPEQSLNLEPEQIIYQICRNNIEEVKVIKLSTKTITLFNKIKYRMHIDMLDNYFIDLNDAKNKLEQDNGN